ncbi:MAG TPA: cyanophycin synthetase [Rickettsiales bacterium]|nr:cyanophycin synthetase [Rickettsiales bacterium]
MGQAIAEFPVLASNANKDVLSPPLHVLECRIYRGPHLYSHKPMIRLQVDLGALEDWPSNKLSGFTEKLVACLPGLHEHTCSRRKAGGFVERLHEGTWIGHIIEHVAIELQTMAGLQVTRGKTRSVKGKPGHYNIMYTYRFEEAGLYAGRAALDLVASLLPSPFNQFKGVEKVYSLPDTGGFDLEKALAELRRLVRAEKFGPTTQSLVDEAERRDIPWFRLDEQSLVQLGTGKYRKLIRASVTSTTSNMAVETASDKELTKKILRGVSIPVPEGEAVRTVEGALEVARNIGFPITIKPLDCNHGRGVSTCLHTLEMVTEAFNKAKELSHYVIIEKHYTGKDYRVLVVNGEVIAAAERVPAHVIGNGRDSIAALIEKVNDDPRRGDGHEDVMTRIKVDDALIAWLARSGMTLESVPALKQHVVLAATANLSTGGTAIDRTDDMHPDNAGIARRASLMIGLDVAGIDMIVPDISRSWRETGGGIVEVNASPGFRMHLYPAEGRPRDVAKPVISALFPAHQKTRAPVIAITGTNGKSTTVRMVAHILRQSGLKVGFTSTSGVYVGDDCIWEGDASGPKSARMLLKDPTIDVAVLETARGGIIREGLGVMDCDIGAVLNVTEDHIGISGVETIEDLAAIKSVVVESVHSGGISVLNADDPRTLAMAEHAGGSVCYFSMSSAKGGPLREHLEKGGRCVSRETIGGKAQLVMYRDGIRIPIVAADEIPATYSGAAAFNIENALAAIAIASGLDIDPQVMRSALMSFSSSYEQNPGRFNIHDGHGFRIIVDYAHNPAALRAFFRMIRHMRGNYLRVIGHVSTPGDRRDEDILEVGRIAGKELDLAVFREKPDTRGRPDGEIVRLLCEGARLAGRGDEHIIGVYSEEDATELCLQKARPGDLVILTPSDVEQCWKQVMEFKPDFQHPHHSSSLKEMQTYV